ncbi:hypothetical protein G9A89_021359 [Geosiphon pyriformis]|nr:hypothetical protein G9A89_021359 [Geosiphon pyriformis]
MQSILDTASSFFKMVDIEVNLDKTETIVVKPSKGRLLMVEQLKFGPNKQILKLLDPFTCTQYLGVWIRADGKNKTVLKMIGSDIEAICAVIKERDISFRSDGNTHEVLESSRPQAYLIETIIPSSTTYIKVRSLLRKKNILYLHQIQNKDKSLMTWMDFTRKYRQNDSGRILRWFKILESMIIMDKHRNIDVTQCEVLGMHKLTNQIPDDLETIQRDTIYIHIPNTLLPQWRGVQEKLRLRKEIEISTDGSLVKAGSNDVREVAAFIIHGMEAEFGIAVDETLSSTKTEVKAVLLALEAVPYRCKLTINTDSQALKTSNWHTWNAIRAIVREKRIDLNMNKVAAHTGMLENEKADKLAKESTNLDTVRWVYNAKEIAYIPLCRRIELDLNIRHFLSEQTSLQVALDWIDNNKVQEMLGSLDQDIDWMCKTKIWNWDGKMSLGFTSAGSSAMCTFIMKSFHNMLPTAEVLYNRCPLVYLNNLCKICHREVETNQHFWECSLNTQEGKTLINDVRDKWIQCLSKAVRGECEALNTNKKIVLSNEYIMSTSNIDLLYKGLINKQFGRINTFADIDLKTNNNILIKVCKWAVNQARNRLWREHCKLQTKWEKSMSIDNRVKKIHLMSPTYIIC